MSILTIFFIFNIYASEPQSETKISKVNNCIVKYILADESFTEAKVKCANEHKVKIKAEVVEWSPTTSTYVLEIGSGKDSKGIKTSVGKCLDPRTEMRKEKVAQKEAKDMIFADLINELRKKEKKEPWFCYPDDHEIILEKLEWDSVQSKVNSPSQPIFYPKKYGYGFVRKDGVCKKMCDDNEVLSQLNFHRPKNWNPSDGNTELPLSDYDCQSCEEQITTNHFHQISKAAVARFNTSHSSSKCVDEDGCTISEDVVFIKSKPVCRYKCEYHEKRNKDGDCIPDPKNCDAQFNRQMNVNWPRIDASLEIGSCDARRLQSLATQLETEYKAYTRQEKKECDEIVARGERFLMNKNPPNWLTKVYENCRIPNEEPSYYYERVMKFNIPIYNDFY